MQARKKRSARPLYRGPHFFTGHSPERPPVHSVLIENRIASEMPGGRKADLPQRSELENRAIEVSNAALCGAFSESAACPKSRTPAALTTYDPEPTPKAKTAPHRPITRFSHLTLAPARCDYAKWCRHAKNAGHRIWKIHRRQNWVKSRTGDPARRRKPHLAPARFTY
jgi:hypothetical protein